ncbi:MAG: NUDIX domain-containing protein [Actinomycetota bacterium]
MDPGDELVDVVDEDDRVIAVVTRAEMRSRNLMHRCAEIAVRSTAGEIWVHRRTDTKDVYPGLYDMVVGGVLASGESWVEGARRELGEETGIADVELRELARHTFEGPFERAVMRLYEVTWDGQIVPQPEEIAWGTFVAIEELDRMVRSEVFCPDSVELFDLWRDGRLDP